MFGSATRRRKVQAIASTAARIEQLYLVGRADGQLVDQMVASADAADTDEQRSTASMIVCLLGFLRDAECLERYAALGHLRIQHLTFGIHAGKRFALLSLIKSAQEIVPKELLAQCSALLDRVEGEPVEPAKGILSRIFTVAENTAAIESPQSAAVPATAMD